MARKKKDSDSDANNGIYPLSEYPDCRDKALEKGLKFVVYGCTPKVFAIWEKGEPIFRSKNIEDIRKELGIKGSSNKQ
jgi:hypothetical protein